MNLPDITGGYSPALALRADLQARLLDFLARKELPLTAGLEALWKAAESTLSRERWKSTVRSLVSRFRRTSAGAPVDPEQAELAGLFERIHLAGRERSIESYPQYLFTVDQPF
jgi:hypothetical protein